MTGVAFGVYDNPHVFKHAGEIFTNYKLEWLKDNGCMVIPPKISGVQK
jgi:hypothetical protein